MDGEEASDTERRWFYLQQPVARQPGARGRFEDSRLMLLGLATDAVTAGSGVSQDMGMALPL